MEWDASFLRATVYMAVLVLWLATHSADPRIQREREGKRLGDEFAADGFSQRMEGLPRRGIGNSRRPYRLNSDNKPSPQDNKTRTGLKGISFCFIREIERIWESNVKLEERAPAA